MDGKIEIIAEIGQNWQGNGVLLGAMIESAKNNGADAVKVQLYNANILYPEGNQWKRWAKYTQFDRSTFIQAKMFADSLGIKLFASVFDEERIEWCESARVERYKIASRSVNDEGLVKAICATGKPVIISHKNKEFPYRDSKVSRLFCIPEYPATIPLSQLRQVDFNNVFAGFSDHTIGIQRAGDAFLMGAKIIEKHFTFDHLMYGPDHVCSMTPKELNMLDKLRKEIESAEG